MQQDITAVIAGQEGNLLQRQFGRKSQASCQSELLNMDPLYCSGFDLSANGHLLIHGMSHRSLYLLRRSRLPLQPVYPGLSNHGCQADSRSQDADMATAH